MLEDTNSLDAVHFSLQNTACYKIFQQFVPSNMHGKKIQTSCKIENPHHNYLPKKSPDRMQILLISPAMDFELPSV